MAMRSLPPPPSRAATLAQPCVARIVDVHAGAASFDVTIEHDGAPVRARVASTLREEDLHDARAAGHSAVVVFERGDPALPIVVGLLAPPRREAREPAPASAPRIIEADVDGKRVKITAEDEIVLQCGPASITLRRNGRLVIRGAYVETHATGTNRIKGGQVLIN